MNSELAEKVKRIIYPKKSEGINYWNEVKDKASKLTSDYSEEDIKEAFFEALFKLGFDKESAKKTSDNIIPPNLKQSQEIINKIKSKSKKLPEKSLKLESMVEDISRELLYSPPHYKVDRYSVILTQDLNDSNIQQFVNKFHGGRILEYGSIANIQGNFAQELVFKVIKDNDLKINQNFYYVIFEGLDNG